MTESREGFEPTKPERDSEPAVTPAGAAKQHADEPLAGQYGPTADSGDG